MTCWKSIVLGSVLVASVGGGQRLLADDGYEHGERQAVTVTFGTGLNQPGALNHHVLPQVITVRTTPATSTAPAVPAVVTFVVVGFHQLFVYNPGVTPDDITAFLAVNDPGNAKLFINDLSGLFYEGINPVRLVAGVPTYNDNTPPPNPHLFTDTNNRVESIGFTTPGTYLVICNVRPHFQDGMYAWVKVVTDASDDSHGSDRR